MRISGIAPSSVILSQTEELKRDVTKVPKVCHVINPQNNNFNDFNTENGYALKTLRIN